MFRESIMKIFDTMGLQVTDYKDDDLIKEYIHDSLALVSFMVYIEDKFEIEIDAEYFSNDFYETSFKELEKIILVIKSREKCGN